ncbi:MAG: SOS response-associated peptidase family protein [Coriobacteriales bacterium]|nr:SOS response-associated peptidase family protein [Coriobacteriaceae bacterium]MDY2722625.1 SOS response-associated peptidase family protein [Coriobacteriales bacterium]
MCGRVKQLSWDEVRRVVEQLERGGALSSDPGWQATLFDRADARPMSVLAVVSGEKGTLRAQRMSWGFPVSWQASPVFNTRLDSALAGGNMWELPLREHRCIVPVAAFFEKGRKGASGYAFSNDGPLLLGGVFEEEHCSIVTTPPNSVVAPVHDRMPLVLSPDGAQRWLSGDIRTLVEPSRVPLVRVPTSELSQPSLF